MSRRHLLIENNFSKTAAPLRSFYEKNFSNPRSFQQKRFVWDYWVVPGQYRLMRTPAYLYFPQRIYSQLHSQLVQWGREKLGCHDISPPWLSYYFEGCRQNLHSDVPHGPWAFVYSLSPRQLKFSGGETFLLRPEALNYWTEFHQVQDREENSFIEKIRPDFNRLVVFDPRIPHGVTEVRGTEDPLEARLVIHGWFVEPRPYVVGALKVEAAMDVLTPWIYHLGEALQKFGSFWGTLSLRVKVLKNGKVSGVQILTNTLVSTDGNEQDEKLIEKWIVQQLKKLQFPRARASSAVTLPLMFK